MSVRPRVALTLISVLAMIACTSSSEREAPARPDMPSMPGGVRAMDSEEPTVEPLPGGSPLPATSPSPLAPSCAFGPGTLNTTCTRTSQTLLPQVNAAIDALVRQRPELFDLNSAAGDGGYGVLNPDEYYKGVVAQLQGAGLCAGYDYKELQVRNSAETSERYDILLSTDHIRRGEGSYRSTCNPPDFPVDPAEYINSLRVAFFAIECPPGRTPPPNGAKLLPLECAGFVTATPKDIQGRDVDQRLHGSAIEWYLRDGENVVRVEDFRDVPFNKYVKGVDLGDFSLCAVVLGVEGCLNATVIP